MTLEPTRTVRHTITIEASPAEVFPYLTDPILMTRWMGDYAVLDAVPGGTFLVDINGVPVRGTYLEVQPPHRVVVSWGMAGSTELPPGASTVEFVLTQHGTTTDVAVTHSGLPPEIAAQHHLGWQHFGGRIALAATGRDPGPDPWATESARPT
ncbi:MAG: SRPBCC domain-containing protein [Acidimicrobiales bacterium]